MNSKKNIYTKSVHIYSSKKSNCGVIPDNDGLIFHFGETKELYPTKHIKILVNNELDKIDIAKSLRKLADILEGKKKVQYEKWYQEKNSKSPKT